jgi:hypothetical protein
MKSTATFGLKATNAATLVLHPVGARVNNPAHDALDWVAPVEREPKGRFAH